MFANELQFALGHVDAEVSISFRPVADLYRNLPIVVSSKHSNPLCRKLVIVNVVVGVNMR